MLNIKALQTATVIGTVLQLAMVIAGHFIPAVAALFAVGGMGISLVAGLLYGRAAGGLAAAALGGVIAGGVCALIGIAVSAVLSDVPPIILLIGTLGSAAAGAVGGVIGRFIPRSTTASA